MQTIFFTTIFIFKFFDLSLANPSETGCDFRIERAGNVVTIFPFLSGGQFTEGHYELRTTNVVGTNISQSTSAGYFRLNDASQNQTIAQIRINAIPSGQTNIEMSVFSNGNIAKCTVTYPE